MSAPHLRLHADQQALTPQQEAEADRFAQEWIAAYLSTAPVDERGAEYLLCQACAVAGLPAPQEIHWLDGPLQLEAILAPLSVGALLWDRVRDRVRAPMGARVPVRVRTDVVDSLWTSVRERVGGHEDRVRTKGRASAGVSLQARLEAHVQATVEERLWSCVWDRVSGHMQPSVVERVGNLVLSGVGTAIGDRTGSRVGWRTSAQSVRAYAASIWFAVAHYFDTYLAPNDSHALTLFNARVSGYWLGQGVALLVRRPHRLILDNAGRLHSASHKCVEYPDGWGFYAWHGVRVPEKVILAPEALTREDFLGEHDLEARRAIQERMGPRFVSELRGKALDEGPCGTLYEVRLPAGDPERVARYVQVQDASTPRQYMLRVPPTVETAEEAVAWTFQLSVGGYYPIEET